MRMRLKALAAGMTVALVAVAGVHAAPPALAAKTITVWSDAAHAPVIEKLTKDGYEGYSFVVVVKDPATVGADLAEATPATAPDVLWGDLAATGQLAGSGTIVPVKMTKKNRALFRPNVLDASNVGADRFGIPVQISNLALVTNTALVPKQPATFSELSAIALNLEKKKKAKIPFAVGQGPGSNGVNLYPLFSSLGGYFFGRGADGSLDPTDVGLMNPTFRKNAAQIDAWNASGLIDSSLTPERARTAFVKGRSAFWLAGPGGPRHAAEARLRLPHRRRAAGRRRDEGGAAADGARVHGHEVRRGARGRRARGQVGQPRDDAGRVAAGPGRRLRLVPGQHRRRRAGRNRQRPDPGDRQRRRRRRGDAQHPAGSGRLGAVRHRVVGRHRAALRPPRRRRRSGSPSGRWQPRRPTSGRRDIHRRVCTLMGRVLTSG